MPHSLEQGKEIHKARRILKLIAPDFRILARDDLESHYCVLDLEAKTIEISESTPEIEAVAGILFQVGHLRLRDRPELREHFGRIEDIGEKRLIKRLVEQGSAADRLAAKWSKKVFLANWAISDAEATRFINAHVWKDADWNEYYR